MRQPPFDTRNGNGTEKQSASQRMVRSVATDLFGRDAVAEVQCVYGQQGLCFHARKNPNGCYFTLVAPAMSQFSTMVHNPGYDFNDNILLTRRGALVGHTDRTLSALIRTFPGGLHYGTVSPDRRIRPPPVTIGCWRVSS